MKNITVAIAHTNQVRIIDNWALELIWYAQELGYIVVDITGLNLLYDRVTQILQARKPAILFYFGLGDKAHLIGNNMLPALTSQNASGTPVVAYSSHAAAQLGPELIKAGSPCFVGFSDELIIVSDKYGIQDIFKESLLPLAKRILEGWTVGAAVEATRSDLLNAVRRYKDHEITSVPLFSNRKSLKYLGDPNWKLKTGGN